METNESSVSTQMKPACPSPACPGHPESMAQVWGRNLPGHHTQHRAKVSASLPALAPRCPAFLCGPELLILPGTARIAPHSSRDLELRG